MVELVMWDDAMWKSLTQLYDWSKVRCQSCCHWLHHLDISRLLAMRLS